LWRNPDFLKFWAGRTVSLFGDEVSTLALPLVAITTLYASAGEMGVLAATGRAPIVVVGLLAGVWVDRVRRRPLLVGADLGRALLLGSIPVAASLSLLTLPVLYAVSSAVATLGLLHGVASGSYLPALVARTALVDGNSKLVQSRSVAGVAGPGLAGVAIQLLTAPGALVLDAWSFVVSAICICLIGQRELPTTLPPAPPGGKTQPQPRPGVWHDIGEGLRAVWKDRFQRAPAGAIATYNLFFNVIATVYVLYLTRELGMGPAALSVLLALYAVGGLGGSLVAARVGRNIGVGPVMVVGIAASGAKNLVGAITLHVAETPATAFAVVAAVSLLRGVMGPFYGINQLSLQQAITPDQIRGRVNATIQFVVGCTGLLDALAGGVLGEAIGLLPAITVGAAGTLLAVPWLFFSELRRLRELPASSQVEQERK